MIRWTFYFDQGNVSSEVHNESDDREIAELVEEASGLIWIPGNPQIYVNLDHTKAITREIVQEQPVVVVSPQQEELKEVAEHAQYV